MPIPKTLTLVAELSRELERNLPSAIAAARSRCPANARVDAIAIVYPDACAAEVVYVVALRTRSVDPAGGDSEEQGVAAWDPGRFAACVDVAGLGPSADRYRELCAELTTLVLDPLDETSSKAVGRAAFSGLDLLRDAAIHVARRANADRSRGDRGPARGVADSAPVHVALGQQGADVVRDLKDSMRPSDSGERTFDPGATSRCDRSTC